MQPVRSHSNPSCLLSTKPISLSDYQKIEHVQIQKYTSLYDSACHSDIICEGLIKTHIIQVWISEHVCLTEFLNDPFP